MPTNTLLTFYADTPTELNRYFRWKVSSRSNAVKSLDGFRAKGWKIRAAWYSNKALCVNEKIV